ncbi:MAG: hypothetical protein JWL60_512 [Gemmatimonadetes bacterium]|nr:hypothetical protein [Gemmatimonadota bacterium]
MGEGRAIWTEGHCCPLRDASGVVAHLAIGTDVAASWDADGGGVPEPRTVDFTYGPLLDASARPDGVVALVIDASDQARSESAERAATAAAGSAARFAAVLDALPDAAAVYDHDWRYTYLNPAAHAVHRELFQLLGLDPAGGSAPGHIAWEVFPFLVGTQFEVESRRAVAEQRVTEYVEYAAARGQWFETRIVPTATGIVSFNRGVTVQRAVQQQREQLLEAERIAAERLQRLQRLTALLDKATTTTEIAGHLEGDGSRDPLRPCWSSTSAVDLSLAVAADLAVPPPALTPNPESAMLTIGVILLVLWFIGFMIARKVLGALIHLVLIVAIALVAWHYLGPMPR